MKRSGFKMRSGNGPLAFKMMGSSPVKQEYQPTSGKTDANNLLSEVKISGKRNIAQILGIEKVDRTVKPITRKSAQKVKEEEVVVNNNQEVSSSNKVKKPGIDTQIIEWVKGGINKQKGKNKIKKEEKKKQANLKLQADLKLQEEKNQAKLNSSKVKETKVEEEEVVVEKNDKGNGNVTRDQDVNHEFIEKDVDFDDGGDEKKKKKKKKGWKFDIDWDEVATNAIGAVVTTGIKAALGGGSKKVARKGGSISGFAAQKFSSGTNLFAKKSDSI